MAVLDADRATFDRWLRWSSGVRTLEEARAFIARATDAERAGTGFHWGLWMGGRLIGGVPCWSIDSRLRVAELGYWLASSARGTGLATIATRAAMEFLLAGHRVDRVEFHCRLENESSRRVAERLGGRLQEGRRVSYRVDGAIRDHLVYAVSAEDRATPSA